MAFSEYMNFPTKPFLGGVQMRAASKSCDFHVVVRLLFIDLHRVETLYYRSVNSYLKLGGQVKPSQNKKGQRTLRYPTKGLLFCQVPQIFLALLILKQL